MYSTLIVIVSRDYNAVFLAIVDFYKAVSVYANRLLLWVEICDATECFVKALPMGQNIVLDKSYTKLGTDISSRTLQAAVIATRNKINQ